MNLIHLFIVALTVLISCPALTHGGPAGAAVRETAEVIMKKFGKGAAGQSLEEVAEATTRAVARYGDDALPFLRRSGHVGFDALKEAGEQAPEIIRLFAQRGDDAIWLISDSHKLALFLKHGDLAANALLRHPGIADNLVSQYGGEAAEALSNLSRQGAQRLNILTNEGLLASTNRSPELLNVIARYGDGAMNFIWRNKGPLAVASVLTAFLADPEPYLTHTKDLIIDPIISPIAKSTNWTLIIVAILGITYLPFITRSIIKAGDQFRSRKA
jgi:hypothetical protein